MVNAKGADPRRDRLLHQIGGIKLATDACLIHGDVDAFGQKSMPAHKGEVPRVEGPRARRGILRRGARLGEPVPYLEEVLCEKLLGQRSRVDADAFSHSDEMGRDEEAYFGEARAVLRKDGVDEGAGAAFAFCACYVDDVEAVEVRGL